MSLESCNAIFEILIKHYRHVGVTTVSDISDLEALVANKPDLVFLGMEFIKIRPVANIAKNTKLWIANYLDENNITYTGSNQMAHKLGRNKSLAKQRVIDVGLNSSPYYVVRQNQLKNQDNLSLTYPLFVKPTNRGGGLGIDSRSLVHNVDQLLLKIQSITSELQSDSLVEEYLPGREFSVAILRNEGSTELSVMPIELIAPSDIYGNKLLSGMVKSANTEQAIEVLDDEIKTQVNDLALDVFKALGCQDYGRIDIRLDQLGIPNFLEVNLMPSLISGYGSFPKACLLNIGLNYESMIIRIVSLGLARSEANATNVDNFTSSVLSSNEPALT
jgi:D-alanine-D-alanine ligase